MTPNGKSSQTGRRPALRLLRLGRRFHTLKVERLHRLRRDVYDADAVRVRIGDVELAAREADSRRLAERAGAEPAPVVPAEERRELLRFQVEHANLTVVGIRDIELAVVVHDTERVLEARFFLVANGVFELPRAVLIAEHEQAAADQRLDAALPAERNLAQRADLAIRDVEVLAVGREAARLGEVRERQGSVANVLAAAAGKWADLVLLQVER